MKVADLNFYDISKGWLYFILKIVHTLNQQRPQSLYQLSLRHNDPFERIMITQALCEDLALMTRDSTIHLYSGLDLTFLP